MPTGLTFRFLTAVGSICDGDVNGARL